MIKNKSAFTLSILASSLILSACSEDDVATLVAPTDQEIAINFAAQVNGQDFICGQSRV